MQRSFRPSPTSKYPGAQGQRRPPLTHGSFTHAVLRSTQGSAVQAAVQMRGQGGPGVTVRAGERGAAGRYGAGANAVAGCWVGARIGQVAGQDSMEEAPRDPGAVLR
jgi:hypothetical protein